MTEMPKNVPVPGGDVLVRTSLRSVAERGVHILWALHFVVTLGLVCMAFGLILFEVMAVIFPVRHFDPMRGTVDLLLLIGGLNVPICVTWRYYGVLHLHFLDHESYLLKSNSDLEESFLSSCGVELERLLVRLEQAPLMDRQAVRRQLRGWLDAHHQELTDAELDDVEARCPYLFDSAWRQRGERVN
jgi:hypothetical protein